MGLSPGVHTMVGVYSRNCPEWVIAEQGAYSHSMVLVPLYDSLGPDARSYVISQCDMRLKGSLKENWFFTICLLFLWVGPKRAHIIKYSR